MIRLSPRSSQHAPQNGQSAGRYFTDGINLYRFVGWVDRTDNGLAAVEDCRSLELLLVGGQCMNRPGLRLVPHRPREA
jgi:hypothetical protein